MTEPKTKESKNLWTGAFIGFLFSALASLLITFIQHRYTKSEKQLQLFLDEKKDFIHACDEYLNEYRDWHELMNYYTYADSLGNLQASDLNNEEKAVEAFHKWKKDFDVSYGKIFLVSDNEFGTQTMTVSTVLYGALNDVMQNKYSLEKKKSILDSTDSFFFENWLSKAQEEIFRYNTGERKQKTIREFIEDKSKEN